MEIKRLEKQFREEKRNSYIPKEKLGRLHSTVRTGPSLSKKHEEGVKK